MVLTAHGFPGVNFINVCLSSFHTRRSQKCKKTDDLTVFFALQGSACAKAACRTMMKLTPGSAPNGANTYKNFQAIFSPCPLIFILELPYFDPVTVTQSGLSGVVELHVYNPLDKWFSMLELCGGPPRSKVNIFAAHPKSFEHLFCKVQTLK